MTGMAKQTMKVSSIALRLNWKKLQLKPQTHPDVVVTTDAPRVVVGETSQEVVVRALKRQQYHVIPPPFKEGVGFHDYSCGRLDIEVFVEHGDAALLEEVGTRQGKAQITTRKVPRVSRCTSAWLLHGTGPQGSSEHIECHITDRL
jgi:hypothetical protein